jgi:hypothetical protein
MLTALLISLLPLQDLRLTVQARDLLPDVEGERYSVVSSSWVAWEASGRPTASRGGPASKILRRPLEGGPAKQVFAGRCELLAVGDDGTVMLLVVPNNLLRIGPDGERRALRLPGHGTHAWIKVQASYMDGIVLTTAFGSRARHEFLPLNDQGFGPPILLTTEDPLPGRVRQLFLREGDRLAWISASHELHVYDLRAGSRRSRAVPEGFILDGLYGDLILGHSNKPLPRAWYLNLSGGFTRHLVTPTDIGVVLPEGILMSGEFWDPLSGRRFLQEVHWWGATRRVLRRNDELWLLRGVNTPPRKTRVLPLGQEPSYVPVALDVDLDDLRAQLSAEDPPNSGIYQLLGRLGRPLGPEAIAVLTLALGHADVHVRHRAAGMLAWDGGGLAVGALLDALPGEADFLASSRIAEGLARSGDPRATEALLKLDHTNYLGRNKSAPALARALAVLGDPRVVPLLEGLRPNADQEVAEALEVIAGKPAILEWLARLR